MNPYSNIQPVARWQKNMLRTFIYPELEYGGLKKFAIYTKIRNTNLYRPYYQLVILERFKSRQTCNLKNYWSWPASSTFWSAPSKNPNQGTNLICKHLEHKVCQSSLWFDVAVCKKKSKQDYVNHRNSAIIFFIYLCWAFLLWIIFAKFWKLLFVTIFLKSLDHLFKWKLCKCRSEQHVLQIILLVNFFLQVVVLDHFSDCFCGSFFQICCSG